MTIKYVKKFLFNIAILFSLILVLFGCKKNDLKDFRYEKTDNETIITGLKNIKAKELYIPEGVTGIKEHAFDGCYQLDLISIPLSLKTIDITAIRGHGIEEIYYSGTIIDWLNINVDYFDIDEAMSFVPFLDFRKVYFHDEDGTIEKKGKKYSLIDRIIIPDGTTEIGNCLFSGQKAIKSIVFPNSVTKIGNGSFAMCDFSFTELDLPDNLISIGKFAFCQDTNIKTIRIPKSLEYIGSSAFRHCNITTVYYEGSEEDWNKITIDENWNQSLLNADVIFNS